jgi:hypothetical protein
MHLCYELGLLDGFVAFFQSFHKIMKIAAYNTTAPYKSDSSYFIEDFAVTLRGIQTTFVC